MVYNTPVNHEPTKKGSYKLLFFVLGMFYNFNPFLQHLEHMYGHSYMCSTDFFLF